PQTIKTVVTKTKELVSKQIETIYDTLPSLSVGSMIDGLKVISINDEPFGVGTTKRTVIAEARNGDLSVPTTTYDESTSYVELDIRQHPDWDSTFKDDWDSAKGEFKPESEYFGISSYIVGSTTVTKTEYFSTEPASRYSVVGKLEAPGGGYSGSNNWLIIGGNRRKIGEGLYSRETVYLYSAKGYNSDIYS
ncbi:MAG: hypothetical protein IAE97_13665, partial [Chthoniobacterales bacterium]|nr:hypothetical protein [Chthoniobacterales bacterium]